MRLLRAKAVAEVLATTEARVYELARTGILPTVHLGRNVRFEERALREFVSAGGRSLPGGWRKEPGEGSEITGP